MLPETDSRGMRQGAESTLNRETSPLRVQPAAAICACQRGSSCGSTPLGATSRVRKIASDRDNIVIEQRREEATAALALASPMDDVIGGDEYDTLIVDTPESRD